MPADSKPVKLTIINAIGDEEIKSRAEKMIMSGVALSDETLENLTTIIKYLEMKFDVDAVPNKEFSVRLCELLSILPKNPVEFLRYIIYKVTGSTLLIKSPETILRVKNTPADLDKFFADYIAANGLERLAEIFYGVNRKQNAQTCRQVP